ncbi:MAG: TMEM165/GDT1 family protein [Euryarchaeota archaeon]|nr:TMEM165/GDT1 family protein [Euryarchaeota archaeon]
MADFWTGLFVLGMSFGLTFLAELGDKTQIMTITFASKYDRKTVFAAAFLALGLLAVIGVLVGEALVSAVPSFILYLKLASGALFIALGVWSLVRKEKGEAGEIKERRSAFFTVFSMTAMAELGDKTQIMAIILTMQYGQPEFVLAGILLGFACVVALGVLIGALMAKKVPKEWVERGSAALFIILGVVFIAEALLAQ